MIRWTAALLASAALVAAQPADDAPPNIVIVFTDDQGYGDLSCYGHPTIRTPNIDRLAAEGTKFSQFYVASPVCSPSRAALLTGCYPKRVGMHEHVIFPDYDHGLHTDEVTIADVLRERGYATGCFGKWHLGHRPGLMPTDQGFDTFAGVPYSNDMSQFHREPGNNYSYRLPWITNNEVQEWEPDQRLLTRRTTEAAVKFIEQNQDRPFFAYIPHVMPHIPLYASAEFEGKSPRGLYGDVIEELDWSVGQITAALERLGLTENTLIIFSSDNGPWLPFKLHGGSAGPLRGGKGSNWEGGQRVPCVVRWPAQVPAGRVCHEVATAMDLLPTIAGLTGAALPADRPIDGHDISSLLRGEAGATSPTEQLLYYSRKGKLAGIRRGAWKLVLNGDQLYQLEHDIGEQWDVSADHGELVDELRDAARRMDAAITRGARPTRTVAETLFDPARPSAPR